MAVNRGKQFEDRIKEQLEKIPDTVVIRLYDIMMGYKQINNPCDFIVFRKGTLNLFELKTIHGNTLNFSSNIRENQWNGLLEYSKYPGVNAGILVWFIDLDLTLFLDIGWLQWMKEKGYKSFNASKNLDTIPISVVEGEKKRTFFEYNLKQLLEDISYE